jgi:glycosyltransferase involved in cell wall biosynthesis
MEDQKLLVSILMPIYKVEKYLARTLETIFSQTYSNLEYVFVNDCSPDNSLQVLIDTIKKHGVEKERYTIINHDQNEGIAVSRTDCIANAKGDYIFFVDSDDWIENDAVEQMIAATQSGTIDIVGCDFMKDFVSGKITYHHECYAETCKENMLKCLNYDIATVLWKLLIRRNLFDYFVISPINIGEDYVISIKLFYYADSFVSLNKAFYHYVQYNQNRLSFQSLRSINDHIRCVHEVEHFLRLNGYYDDFVEHQLLLRKYNIKSNFVLNKMLLDEKSFISTFPEAKGMWREMSYSRREKFKFWLAENRMFILLKLI